MLDELSKFEVENFEEEFADQNWYKGRQQKEIDAMEKARKRGKLSEPISLYHSLQLTSINSHYEGSAEDLESGQEVCHEESLETKLVRAMYIRQFFRGEGPAVLARAGGLATSAHDMGRDRRLWPRVGGSDVQHGGRQRG